MKKSGKTGKPAIKRTEGKRLTKKQQLCIECRKCCGKVGVYTDPAIYEIPERDIIHFYETRGATVTKEDGHLFILFDLPCPENTTKGCAVYEKRPKICRIYSGQDEFGEECLWSTLTKRP